MFANFIAVLSFLVEILQWKILHLNYASAMITCGFMSLDPGKPFWYIRMAESNNYLVAAKLSLTNFEPVHVTGYGDSEDDSSKSNSQVIH